MTAPPARTDPYPFGRHSPNLVHLDAQSVEAVARRVVEFLTGTQATGMIDAAELARRMGVSRDWVYRHADELGAVRVGDGQKARLRFDPDVACRGSRRSVESETPAKPAKRPGRPPSRAGTDAPLLPIRGRQEAS